jgi:hypothetical protein
MKWKDAKTIRRALSTALGAGTLSFGFALFAGCAGRVDSRFSAETYDEYTEPLTNAVIGTPTGVITVGVPTSDAGSAGGSGSSGSSSGVSGGGGGTAGGGASSGGGFSDAGVFDDGGFSDGGPGQTGGSAQWSFDDCSPKSNFLADTTGGGANAQHALGASCVPGIKNLGVQIRTAKDVVQVPDEPEFTVSTHVAVAAWVNPTTVSGNQPIVIKRLNNQTSFSLGVHNGNIEMSVVLSSGTTVISRAPIAANTFTHVAGMYDGTFVFLFINGQQFGQIFAAGALRNVFAPIRIGATTQTQHFSGIIDEVFLSTDPNFTKEQLAALACITQPSSVSVSQSTTGPVPFDTSVHYDVVATDNDIGACQAKSYDFFQENFDSGISVNVENGFQQIGPGQSADFGVDISGSDSADPGVHLEEFVFDVFGNSAPFGFEQIPVELTFDLAQPTGCFVQSRRELMITNTSVVDDPVRTFGSSNAPTGFISFEAGVPDEGGVPLPPDAGSSPSLGVWSFGHLMREMAPTPDQAPAMVLQLLQHWLTPQTVNGFTVDARTRMQTQVIDLWPKTPSGELDLDQSPLTLEAIVNRIDLRDLSRGSAGEGRMVFGVNGPINFQQFTVIVEYNLPAQTADDVAAWAARWHALSSLTFPSEDYNAALEAITRKFTDHGVQPGNVNGSALVEFRTNEIALSDQGVWELRSFVLSSSGTGFDETTVKETPDFGNTFTGGTRQGFNNTQTLADFANQNTAAIEAVIPGAIANSVPATFEGQNFLAGSVLNPLVPWNAPGIDPELRFHLSTNTCNGCHGPDTNTSFLMVTPRFIGQEAQLSGFITGTSAFDQFTGQTRQLNDLGRRRTDLTGLVCGTDGGTPPPPPADGGVSNPPPELDAGSGPPPPRDAGILIVPPPPVPTPPAIP